MRGAMLRVACVMILVFVGVGSAVWPLHEGLAEPLHSTRAVIASRLFGIPLSQIDDPSAGANYDYNVFGEDPSETCGYQGGHSGIDMQTKDVAGDATADRTFYAVSSGVVVSAGTDDYGTISIWDEDADLSVLYIHTRSAVADLAVGDTVAVGDALGTQGDTGVAGSEHVHLEVRSGRKELGSCGASYSLDPESYIPQYLGSGGPDNFGYTYADCYCPGGPSYNWIDITSSGIEILPDSDDHYVDGIPVGFFFNFYGTDYSQVSITNNGILLASGGTSQYTNQPIGSSDPHNFILPFWDDIVTWNTAGAVYYETRGQAPNRTFVVEWYDNQHYSSSASGITFEAILYEGTNNVIFQYQDVDFGSASYDCGGSATVGIEGPDGRGLQYSYNKQVISAGLAILFKFPAFSGTNMYVSKNAPSSMDHGNTMTYDLYYHNFGSVPASTVILKDALPGDVVFVSASGGGTYDAATREVTWELGTVPTFPTGRGSASVTVSIPEDVSIGTVIRNTASVSTTTLETRYDDNSATVSTRVTGSGLPSGVGIEGRRGDSIYYGDPITFTYRREDTTGVDIRIHIDDGGPDITGSMTGGPPVWSFTTTFYPRHGRASVTYAASSTDCTELAWGARVSTTFAAKVVEISQRLGIDPSFLMAIMAFETGETFSPSETNPDSGATGLIQFLPSTAIDLGTTVDALREMTAEQQLDYVERYFQPYRGRLSTLEDAYMAVLWPRAIGEPNDYVLFSDPSQAYQQNRGLDLDHDGHITKAEASQRVRDRLNEGNSDENVDPCVPTGTTFDIYIDPAGYIYNTDTNARIQGASVWLQRPDGEGGWENVPTGESPAIMDPDVNPLITDTNGQYQWDVLAGSYRVHVEAEGYYPADSIVVSIPPAVNDLHVGLTPLPNEAPTADAGPDQTLNQTSPAGAEVTLDGSGSSDPDGDALTYAWTWSGGSAAGETPVVTLPAGTTEVTLEVSDGDLSDTDTVSITVSSSGPDADFSATPTSGDEPLVVTFTDNSTSAEGIVSWLWDFGDGQTSSDVSPAHTYSDNGTYAASLTVQEADGQADTATMEITVSNVAPTVDAGPDAFISLGDAFSSTGLFSDPGADEWTALVDYGDGSGPQTLALNPDKTFALGHSYAGPGVYTVSVTVADDDGGSGIDTVAVEVSLRAYTITATAGDNGSVSPSGAVVVPQGTDQTFDITPETGYHIADVLVDGVSVGALSGYTFPGVSGDHTIDATFAADEYSLAITLSGNGSVSRDPDDAAYGYGSTVTLTAEAAPGWVFAGWGGDLSGSASPVTITMDGNKAVSAAFVMAQKVNTSVRVRSSANPSVFGRRVTLTAVVKPECWRAGLPTGTVTFMDGDQTLATVALKPSCGLAYARFSTRSLPVGAHSITAVYNGNASFNSSTSSAVMEQVNKARTTVRIVSSPRPSKYGQPVTFTATVRAKAPASGTPAGTVIFRHGSSVIGTATLDASGRATCTIGTLPVGLHRITAVYTGDASFKASTSWVFYQRVRYR